MSAYFGQTRKGEKVKAGNPPSLYAIKTAKPSRLYLAGEVDWRRN